MKKINSILAFLISASVVFFSHADVKTDYNEAMSTPLFKGTDFPFPDVTANYFDDLSVKEFKKIYSKSDTQKMIDYCNSNNIKNITNIPDKSLQVKGAICAKVRRMIQYY